MNVASLELCRELYELSGWEYTEKVWYEFAEGYAPASADLKPEQWKRWECRAYDLGYLLRKLPKFVEGADFWLNNNGLCWTAGYATDKYSDGDFHFVLSEVADTPEDAAAKLAIELFKQGVLSRV